MIRLGKLKDGDDPRGSNVWVLWNRDDGVVYLRRWNRAGRSFDSKTLYFSRGLKNAALTVRAVLARYRTFKPDLFAFDGNENNIT